jgi:hypothetical protein
VGALRKRVTELEHIVHQKRLLSKTDASALHDLPHLEKQLMKLRIQVQSHLRAKQVKVDAGVGVLVDSTFDEFVARIKGELSERLREKEGSMTAQMQADLSSREELFAQRYQSLVQDLDRKYRAQLEEAMTHEVKEHLAEEVHKRIAHERTKLVGVLLKEQAERLHKERKLLITRLEEQYAQKEQTLISHHRTTLSSALGQVALQRAALTERLARIERQRKELLKSQEVVAGRIRAEKTHFKQEEQRLARVRVQAERAARSRAGMQIKAARDRLVSERDAVHHALALQQSHLTAHLDALHAREQSLRQGEEHAKVQLAHERQILQQSFERLQTHERMLADKSHQALVKQKVSLLGRIRAERGKLAQKERTLLLRERSLNDSLAAERGKGRALADKLREELGSVTHALTQHEKDSTAKLAEMKRSLRTKYAREYRSLAHKAHQRSRAHLLALKQTLLHQQKRLHEGLRLVHAREQGMKRHASLLTSSVTHEKQALQSKFSMLLAHEKRLQSEAARALEVKVAQQRAQDTEHYRKQLSAERMKMQAELRERVAQMHVQASAELTRKVAAREGNIRAHLERDYKERLRATLAQKQLLLAKKKSLLEKQVLAQAKRLFK